MRIIALLAALLLAAPALADSPKWFTTPDGSTQTTQIGPQGPVCAYFENDDATTDSLALAIGLAQIVTVSLNPDEDGTNTGATVLVWFLESPTDTCGSAANGEVHPTTLSSATKSLSSRPVRGHLCIETTANPATADEFRVTACAQGSNR